MFYSWLVQRNQSCLGLLRQATNVWLIGLADLSESSYLQDHPTIRFRRGPKPSAYGNEAVLTPVTCSGQPG